MTLTGKIIAIHHTQTFGNGGFQKREFIVETNEKYPQILAIELTNDKVSLIDKFAINDEVEVSFNIRGNKYKDRHYVNLQAWRIVKTSNNGGGQAHAIPSAAPSPSSDDESPF